MGCITRRSPLIHSDRSEQYLPRRLPIDPRNLTDPMLIFALMKRLCSSFDQCDMYNDAVLNKPPVMGHARPAHRGYRSTPSWPYNHISLCHVMLLLYLLMLSQISVINCCYVYPSGVPDPCEEKDCSFGAKCVASVDGTTARCECPQQCPSYGDSVGSKPVCGSDGRDYDNVCEMDRQACASMDTITVRYQGRCDPCRTHNCPEHEVCQVDENRQPVCRCNTLCNTPLRPVCATDGKTYSNECIMRAEACKKRIRLTVQFYGDCDSGQNPCKTLHCGPGQGCHVDRKGRATCNCPPRCPLVLRQVCGTDGRTYDNKCELEQSACKNRVEISVRYEGICDNGPCTRHTCRFGATCVVDEDRARCECPQCTGHYQPVCGSDRVTYDNECKLRAEACDRQVDVTVRHEGECEDPCTNFPCDNYAYCEKNYRGEPQCVCPRNCVQVSDEVCGTDGVTYKNSCELETTSCESRHTISVASQGPCDRCLDVDCGQGAVCEDGICVCKSRCDVRERMVCASDGRTYSSVCEMDRQACLSQTRLTTIHRGQCDEEGEEVSGSGDGSDCDENTCRFGGQCATDGHGDITCTCSWTCDATLSTVCGSDGKTYSNECEMRLESCRQQKALVTQHMDSCDPGLEEVLCGGDPPLLDPITGSEINCVGGADVCGEGSYCHVVEGVAKCCPRQGQKSCRESRYGCCEDGVIAAPGPNQAGCPSKCGCHALGSLLTTCDPGSGQCTCRPGVTSLRCDRCEFAYWGLHKIADGASGCMECGCHKNGSRRTDCNQTSGSCECHRGYTGLKCDRCSDNSTAGPSGCPDSEIVPRPCSQLACRHGAECIIRDGIARCECLQNCRTNPAPYEEVCATNGRTYSSECDLEHYACRTKQDIRMAYEGHCNAVVTPRTSTRSRKTTRHVDSVLSSSKHHRFTPTRGDLGDNCLDDRECFTNNSRCFHNICTCKENMAQTIDGERCDSQGDIFTEPAFAGDSFIEFIRAEQANPDMTIEMSFTPSTANGLLFFASQNLTGSGDFISLALVDGIVEFRYDLGSGQARLSSSKRLSLHTKHTITARRYLKDGLLTVDEEEEVRGSSPGNLESLNLEASLYFGGLPVFSDMDVGIAHGFTGCLAELKITSNQDEKHYDLAYPSSPDIITAPRVGDCYSSDCSVTQCLHGGTCVQQGGTHICHCPPSFSGSTCERENMPCAVSVCHEGASCYDQDDGNFRCECQPSYYGVLCDQAITVPAFSGDSYLELHTSHNLGLAFNFEIWFKATAPDGLLLFSQQENVENGDFLSLSLINGYLMFRYDLGSGPANIRSQFPVPLNTWNQVEIMRTQQSGSMVVNRAQAVNGDSQGMLRQLNLPDKIFLGGYRGDHQRKSGVNTGFVGAVQRFFEDGMLVEPLASSVNSAVNVVQYSGPPCTFQQSLCQNDGECVPYLNDYQCRCPPGTTGLQCETIIDNPSDEKSSRPIWFSGRTSHKYKNRVDERLKAESTNNIKLQFRTSVSEGLLLLLHKSSSVIGDYLAIGLDDGHVVASFNLGKETSDDLLLIMSTRRVDDDRWHTLHFERDKRKGSLQVDDETPISVLSRQGATQLDTNADLWIGGHRTGLSGLPAAFMSGFVGCIDSVVVNSTAVDLVAHRVNMDRVEFCDG